MPKEDLKQEVIAPDQDDTLNMKRELLEPGGSVYDRLLPDMQERLKVEYGYYKQRFQILTDSLREEEGRIYAESNLVALFALTFAIAYFYMCCASFL